MSSPLTAAGESDMYTMHSEPFNHEFNLLNDLSHHNIVSIIGFVEDVEYDMAWMVFTWEKNGN